MNVESKLLNIIHQANKKFPHLQVYVQSKALNHPLIYSPKGPTQPFHSASVGKLATAYVVIRLIERQLLSFDSAITRILDAKSLDNLFVFKGVDYRSNMLKSANV